MAPAVYGAAMLNNPSLALGSVLDSRYVIRHFLAQSGSAEVYVARHRFTERDVVVKLPIRSKATEPTVRQRFEREARALSHIRHPGIVDLVDVGEHEGAVYLALEHMKGRTLGGLLAARGKLEPGETLTIASKLAAVLGHCHKMGVIHRDLKPDNVFILLGAESPLKLFDFGIARLEYDATQHSGRNTQELSVLGTPEYMAPEALTLQGGVDHRVDIYAFGILLYELLTGSVPFEGSYAEVLLKLASAGAPSLRSVRPDLPSPLLSLVDRCLAYEPSQRFSSMEQLADALGRTTLELAPERARLEPSVHERKTVAQSPDARSDAASLQSATHRRGPEARRHPRAPYATLANLTLGETAVSGRVEEISVGGAQFITDAGRSSTNATVESGARAELKFALPISGRVCQVSAIARWTRAARAGRLVIGFEFIDLAEDARQRIADYVTLMSGSST